MFAQLLPLQERVAGLALFLGCFLVDKTDVRETTEGVSLQRCLYVQRRLTHEGIRSIEKQYLGSVMSNNTGSVILSQNLGYPPEDDSSTQATQARTKVSIR